MTNKTIIITGASGTLGREAVRMLSREDYNVVAVSRGSKVHIEAKNIYYCENMDLKDPESPMAVIKEALDKFGFIYGLVNIAGAFTWKTISETSLDDINDMFDANFKTCFNMTKAILPHLKTGRIINIGAMGAINPDMGMASYGISKSAVMRFTEVLSKETSNDITVNAILPSIIDTIQNRNDMPDANPKTWVTTTEIANQISFLLSNVANSTNGQLIPMTSETTKEYENV